MENVIKKSNIILRNLDKSLSKTIIRDTGDIHIELLWDNTYIKHCIDDRKNGIVFSIGKHLRGMVYAMFSAKISRKRVVDGIDPVTGVIYPLDDIFHNYDVDYLLKVDVDELLVQLKKLGCSGKNVKKQLSTLIKYNISKLLDFEKQYGNIDVFYNNIAEKDPTLKTLVRTLSSSRSVNKLKQFGAALTADYLRNVGYDIVKPDSNVRRLLGKKRLGFSEKENATAKESAEIIAQIAKKAKINVAEADHLLFSYCTKEYGFCYKTPNCKKCCIKRYCNYYINPNSKENKEKSNLTNKKSTTQKNTNIVPEINDQTSHLASNINEFSDAPEIIHNIAEAADLESKSDAVSILTENIITEEPQDNNNDFNEVVDISEKADNTAIVSEVTNEPIATEAPIEEKQMENPKDFSVSVETSEETKLLNEPPVIEEFEELTLTEKTVYERKKVTEKRTRNLANISKEELRQQDLKKFSRSKSVAEILTTDAFVAKLIDRYRLLKNKYSNDFPIGLIDVSKEEFISLTSRVNAYINDNSINLTSGFLVSLFLVKAVEYYSVRGDFWGAISAILKRPENEITKFLKNSILAFCSAEKLYFHYYDNNIRSYVGTILIHSVIGNDELDTTLNFIRDFYIEKMNESYSKESVEGFISEFIGILADDVSGEEDEVSSFGGVYQVSFNIKNSCLVFRNAMFDILNCLLFNIHAYYHRLSDVSYSPSVFYKYFKRWFINDRYHKRTGNTPGKKVNSERKVISKQAEKLSENKKCSFFIDENKDLYLYIPPFEVQSEITYDRIVTRFYNGSELLNDYEVENEVYGIFKLHTSEQTIKLRKFYKELSIQVQSEYGEVIFDSKAQLKKNYIIFDSDLTETETKTIPDERFYILADAESDFYADDTYNSYNKANYTIYSLDIEKDCAVTVDNHMVFKYTDESEDAVIFVNRNNCIRHAKVIFNGIEYQIYKTVPDVRIECSKEHISDYIIDIDEKHIGFDELNDNILNLKEFMNSKYVSVVLRKRGNLRHIAEFNIAVIEGFEFTLDKKFYYHEKTAELLDVYADDISLEYEYPYSFEITRSRELLLNAEDNGKEIMFRLGVPIVFWEIDEEINSLSGNRYVYVDAIKDKRFITLDIPVNDVNVIAVNEKMLRPLDVVNHRIDISDFHNSVSESITFGVAGKEIGELTLFEIVYKPTLKEVTVTSNLNALNISYISIGKCSVNLVIKDDNGTEVSSMNYPAATDGKYNYSEKIDNLSDGIYKAEIYIIDSDGFGFSETKKMIGRYEFIKGSPMTVLLKSGDHIEPDYCFFDGDEKKRVHNFYCEDIEKPDNESEIYIGNAFYINQNGNKVYLKDANPVRIELLEKNNKMLTFTITDRDNDGLLYEKARGYLINDTNGIRDRYSYSLPDHYGIRLRGVIEK